MCCQVPEAAWHALKGWYGGGPAIPREVLADGPTGVGVVEAYPYVLQVCISSGQAPKDLSASRRLTIRQLKQKVSVLWHLDGKKFRLWDIFSKAEPKLLKETSGELELIHEPSADTSATNNNSSSSERLGQVGQGHTNSSNNPNSPGSEPLLTVLDTGLTHRQDIFIELQLENGRWPGLPFHVITLITFTTLKCMSVTTLIAHL